MKIKVEIDENLPEDEILIRCRTMDEETIAIQKQVAEAVKSRLQLNVFKGEIEYYLTLDEILFFETSGSLVAVHTKSDIFETKLRLCELEEILPGFFFRISKSAILNTRQVQAVHKNLTGASEVEFHQSHKKVFVSRNYFKTFTAKLEEKRLKK